jgi:methane/ammonia monooxygenase subunit C
MSVEAISGATPAEKSAEKSATVMGLNWSRIGLIFVSIAVVYGAHRVYMHNMAFTVGLDYFEPEFQVYWMSLFWVQMVVAGAAFFGINGYLWMTRERNPEAVTPREELSRYFGMLAWVFTFAVLLGILGSLATESDAAWHQVTIRDTDFTPTHIGLFYFALPALIIAAVGLFVYAKTRLPQHADKYLVPLGIALSGPILILPTVGYNEWGHTFFYAEELFGAPVHWGFAMLGLALLAVGGVIVHILARMGTLIHTIEKDAEA